MRMTSLLLCSALICQGLSIYCRIQHRRAPLGPADRERLQLAIISTAWIGIALTFTAIMLSR